MKTIQIQGTVFAFEPIARPTSYAKAVFKDNLDSVTWAVEDNRLTFKLNHPIVADDDISIGELKRTVIETADWNINWDFRIS